MNNLKNRDREHRILIFRLQLSARKSILLLLSRSEGLDKEGLKCLRAMKMAIARTEHQTGDTRPRQSMGVQVLLGSRPL